MSLPTSDEESNSKLSQPDTGDSSTEDEIKVSTRLEVIALDSPSSGNVSLLEAPSTGSVTSSPRKTDTEPDLESDPQPTEQITLSETELDSKSDSSSKMTVSETELKSDTEKAEESGSLLTESNVKGEESGSSSAESEGNVEKAASMPESENRFNGSSNKEDGKGASAGLDEDGKGASAGLDEDGKGASAGLDEDGKGASAGLDEDGKGASAGLDEDGKDASAGLDKDGKDASAGLDEDVMDASAGLDNRVLTNDDGYEEDMDTSEKQDSSVELKSVQDLSQDTSSSYLPDTDDIQQIISPPDEKTKDTDEAPTDKQTKAPTPEEDENVSPGPSRLSAEERKNILKSQKEDARPLRDVLKEFFEPVTATSPKSQPTGWRRRLDTLDDASEFSFDTQTTRLTSVDSEIEQGVFSGILTPDRARRSISEPMEPAPKIKVERRAFSEAPGLPAKSKITEEMEMGSPVSSFSSQQISYEESIDESENIGESVANLPSQQTSVSESSSNVEKNGEARSLSESSTHSSEVNNQCQNLQSWLNKGNFEDKRHLTGQSPEKSSDVDADTALMPPPDQLKKRLSDIDEKDGTESTSSLSETTPSSGSDSEEVRKLTDWMTKGAVSDDKHLTKPEEHSDNSANSKSSDVKESVEFEVESESDMASSLPAEESKVDLQDKNESESNNKSDKVDDKSVINEPQSSESEESSENKEKEQETSERKTRSKRKRLDTLKSPLKLDSPGAEDSDMAMSPSKSEGLASKKYRSEFSRPEEVAKRTRRRSHSTGSVQDVEKHNQDFRDWKQTLRKRTPKKGDDYQDGEKK